MAAADDQDIQFEESPLLGQRALDVNGGATRLSFWRAARTGYYQQGRHLASPIVAAVVFVLSVTLLALLNSRDDIASPPFLPPPPSSLRLPPDIRPHKYAINISADLDAGLFIGHVAILIEVVNDTSYIVMHSVDLDPEWGTVHIITPDGTMRRPKGILSDPIRDFWVFIFERLKRGEYILEISYTGSIGLRTMKGFYRSPYTDPVSRRQRYIAATQFEAIGARTAFPCFDEPDMKASFEVSIEVLPGLQVISNMPVAEVQRVNGTMKADMNRFIFEPTPKMSTYLLAWAIGDVSMGSVRGQTKRGVNVTTYSQPGREAEAMYSLKVALSTLDFFEKLYAVNFPLPKLDLFPIPEFAGEAMENFGLMIFEDARLMYDPLTSTLEEKQMTALLVAHEIAHQWFGDLVTMAWWDDLWLNEAFAEFMQYEAVDEVEPGWDIDSLFFFNEHVLALRADAIPQSHPIAVPVPDPKDIGGLFDDLTYNKGVELVSVPYGVDGLAGAAVLSMFRAWMAHFGPHGKEEDCGAFCRGLRTYIRKYMYATATTQDLWKELSQQVPGVDEMMNSWVRQAGFPLVVVTPAGGQLDVSQERFTLWKENGTSTGPPSHYIVPLSFVTLSNVSAPNVRRSPVQSETLRGNGASSILPIDPKQRDTLLLVNPKRKGIYRTLYSDEQYVSLAHWLENYPDAFTASERAGTVSDIIALLLSNRLSVPAALSCLQFLIGETSPAVWRTAVDALGEVEAALNMHPGFPHFRSFEVELAKKVCKQVGWSDGENDRTSLLRPIVLQFAVEAGDPHTVAEALARFNNLTSSSNRSVNVVDPELLDTVYAAAILHDPDNTTYDLLYKNFLLPPDSPVRLPGDLLTAMSRSPNLHHQNLTLELLNATRPNSTVPLVPKQEAIRIVATIGTSSVMGHVTAWEAIKEFWTSDTTGMWTRSTRVADMVERVVERFGTAELVKEAERFVRGKHSTPAAEGVRRGCTRARAAQSFKTVRGYEVDDWVRRYLERA
ncbi:hypothetical protein HK104_001746 [Borealophlyctis nickersoniae]|nr:hypothetical protein HK104_001746 [Borealophlyctis nickersoniae]